jgi:hypothetical protein
MEDNEIFFNHIWDILIKQAGVSTSDRERKYFLYAFCEMETPPKDYCIGGKLGAATKFKFEDDGKARRAQVLCSPQDSTPENMMIVGQANDALVKFVSEK